MRRAQNAKQNAVFVQNTKGHCEKATEQQHENTLRALRIQFQSMSMWAIALGILRSTAANEEHFQGHQESISERVGPLETTWATAQSRANRFNENNEQKQHPQQNIPSTWQCRQHRTHDGIIDCKRVADCGHTRCCCNKPCQTRHTQPASPNDDASASDTTRHNYTTHYQYSNDNTAEPNRTTYRHTNNIAH